MAGEKKEPSEEQMRALARGQTRLARMEYERRIKRRKMLKNLALALGAIGLAGLAVESTRKSFRRKAEEEKREREKRRKEFKARMQAADRMAEKLVKEGLPRKDAESFSWYHDNYGGLDEKEIAALWRHYKKFWRKDPHEIGRHSLLETFGNITPKFWEIYDLNDLRDVERRRKEIINNWETSSNAERRFAFVIEAHYKDNPDSKLLKRVHEKIYNYRLRQYRLRQRRNS